MIVAVDPSLNSVGVAVFDSGVLQRCTRIKGPSSDLPIGQRVQVVAFMIADYIGPGCYDFTFEWPQIYTHVKSKGDPNDLIPLSAIGSAVAARLTIGQSLFTPTPAEWIGQCPKVCQVCKKLPGSRSCKHCHGSAWRTPRGRRIELALSPNERRLVPDQHDVIDAVGLGLWRLKRLTTFVQPGAV